MDKYLEVRLHLLSAWHLKVKVLESINFPKKDKNQELRVKDQEKFRIPVTPPLRSKKKKWKWTNIFWNLPGLFVDDQLYLTSVQELYDLFHHLV